MMTRFRTPSYSRRSLVLASVLSVIPQVVAAAEDAPTSPDAVEGEVYTERIVVTGQLQERSLDDTVESVAVKTGAEIERGTSRSVYDLAAEIPNFGQSFGDKGFSIRGIDQRGFGAGNGLLVSVRVDGATLPTNESSFFGPYSAWDLGQIEVFRGPQSTQQGRNSLAGAIIIRSADPTYERSLKGRLTYGSLGTFGGSAAINMPLVEDKVAFRLSIDRSETDGWVDNPTLGSDDYDAREALTLRGKLRFDPSDRFRGLLSFTYVDSSGGEDAIARDLFPGDRFNFSDDRGEEGSEHELLSLELDAVARAARIGGVTEIALTGLGVVEGEGLIEEIERRIAPVTFVASGPAREELSPRPRPPRAPSSPRRFLSDGR